MNCDVKIFRLVIACIGIVNSFIVVAEQRQLRFVGDIFPQIIEDHGNGKVCGIGYDLAKLSAEKLGVTFSFEIIPLKRGLKMVEENEREAIISVYKTPDRGEYLQYTSSPIFVDKIKIFAHKESKIKWNGTVASLRRYRIGLINGWYYGPRFQSLQKHDSRYKFEWISQIASGFKMVMRRRIDVLISNQRNFENFREQRQGASRHRQVKVDNIVPLGPPFEELGLYIAFSKKVSESFVRKFNSQIVHFKKQINKGLLKNHREYTCPP